MAEIDVTRIRLSLPVTILLERRMIVRQRWQVPAWYLTGVVVGSQVIHDPDESHKVRKTATGEEYSWSGYQVTFYKDACERYWHALIGDKPKVYVVCREDQMDTATPVEPLVVTVDYDEATAFGETDDLVLSAEIPPELYQYMERFVLQHYRPKPFEKRKRKKWTDSADKSHRNEHSGKGV